MFDLPFILQTPLAIWGLLSLLIPLGIHLLSKARPQIVAFAHIALLSAKTSPLLRQIRLSQFILLFLRMLMLILATLVLAQVFWLDSTTSSKQHSKTHLLLSEDWLNHASNTEKQRLLDAMNTDDAVLLSTHNRPFNKAQIAQWPTNIPSSPPINLWSKVAEYSRTIPSEESIVVHSTNRLSQFIGEKIALSSQVQWQVKKITVEERAETVSAQIKVIYDDASSSILVYLRAAFAAINTDNNLSLTVNYVNKNKPIDDSEDLHQNTQTLDFSQTELKHIQQNDFILTLAQKVFSSQNYAWWLENSRLTQSQIVDSLPINAQQQYLLKSANKINHATPMHVWLVFTLVLTFLFERILSEWFGNRLKPSRVQ